jgi:hypothetical protein
MLRGVRGEEVEDLVLRHRERVCVCVCWVNACVHGPSLHLGSRRGFCLLLRLESKQAEPLGEALREALHEGPPARVHLRNHVLQGAWKHDRRGRGGREMVGTKVGTGFSDPSLNPPPPSRFLSPLPLPPGTLLSPHPSSRTHFPPNLPTHSPSSTSPTAATTSDGVSSEAADRPAGAPVTPAAQAPAPIGAPAPAAAPAAAPMGGCMAGGWCGGRGWASR